MNQKYDFLDMKIIKKLLYFKKANIFKIINFIIILSFNVILYVNKYYRKYY